MAKGTEGKQYIADFNTDLENLNKLINHGIEGVIADTEGIRSDVSDALKTSGLMQENPYRFNRLSPEEFEKSKGKMLELAMFMYNKLEAFAQYERTLRYRNGDELGDLYKELLTDAAKAMRFNDDRGLRHNLFEALLKGLNENHLSSQVVPQGILPHPFYLTGYVGGTTSSIQGTTSQHLQQSHDALKERCSARAESLKRSIEPFNRISEILSNPRAANLEQQLKGAFKDIIKSYRAQNDNWYEKRMIEHLTKSLGIDPALLEPRYGITKAVMSCVRMIARKFGLSLGSRSSDLTKAVSKKVRVVDSESQVSSGRRL
jgi:hypothetical protein